MVLSELSSVLSLLGNDIFGSSVLFGLFLIGVILIIAMMVNLRPKMALIVISPAILSIAGYGIEGAVVRLIPEEYSIILWFIIAILLGSGLYALYVFTIN